jgi:dolichyl-phosphate beta-glucosyltransferase
MDADLSVNFNQIKEWFTKYKLKSNHAYFGSRSLKSSKVKTKIHRHIIRIILRSIVYLLIDNRINDTQCGFKLYNKSYIQKIFPLLIEKGFVHDIEIIILLKRNKIKIKELPIKWVHYNNSKVRLFIDPIIFFFKIFYIFYKYKKKL